ncbi:MAG: putative LPS assembly protein LptD [Bacteroidetes bacterium]|nr:putative LPS assembly protein LptD [Bacteroidota bacterium]
MPKIFIKIIFTFLFLAQIIIPQSQNISAKKDSSVVQRGLDTTVIYSARDSVIFEVKKKEMNLFGNTNVKHGQIDLKSEQVVIDWTSTELIATGKIDTSKKINPDSIKKQYIGNPILKDGLDTYDGWKIKYNFSTQKGRITLGETEQEQGYYHGEQIKKIEKDVLFIADGRYTTCELDHPHFYFLTPEMKLTMRDKVIARPIYLYISDVPVFYLPFGVFPSKGGRRSGIIAPSYGEDARRGRYITNFGYYEAINDYSDLNLIGDWYAQGGWRVSSRTNYSLRYNFTGSFYGEYSRVKIGEENDLDRIDEMNYRASFVHNQQINPTMRADVDFTFASNNSYRASNNYNDLFRQELYSNATVSKSWEGTNNSMSINISRRQDLLNGNIYTTLPSLSFSVGQFYPFRSGSSKKREYSTSQDDSRSWYELISANYNTRVLKTISRTNNLRNENEGLTHSFSTNFAPKFKNLSLSPYFSVTQNIYDSHLEFKENKISEVKELSQVAYFSTGVSASTRLYGMLNAPISGFGGIRHTVTPSITYTYRPDFSDPKFGYYETYTDTLGRTQKLNKFQNGIFGGAPSGQSQAISFNVGNLFEMKTIANDSARTEKKLQLFNVNGSLSYNMAADKFKLSDLNLSYRTDLGQYLSVSGSSSYRFYSWNYSTNQRENILLLDKEKRFLDLTNVSLSLSTNLKGEKSKKKIDSKVDSLKKLEASQKQLKGFKGIMEEEVPDFSIPWNLGLNLNFSQNQENPKQKIRYANVSGVLSFNLTDNWKVNANASYDLVNKQLAAPYVSIFRDLHCWEMSFNWVPTGQLKGYRFELRVKAPQLQDVKITRQSRTSGYY